MDKHEFRLEILKICHRKDRDSISNILEAKEYEKYILDETGEKKPKEKTPKASKNSDNSIFE